MAARTLLAILALGIASPAFAQAWVPPAGIGVVSVVYQAINNTNHRLTDGSLFDGYDSLSRGVLFNLDYAVTDRFSFSIGVPYLGSKYTGPEPSFFGLDVDNCFCWQHGWQDFGATARYNVVNGAFAFTPSISFGVPTHNYDYFGEAVLGRNLNEVRLAVDVGQRLDRISDRLSVSARYSYALVEKVLDLPNNRSNAALEFGFLATRGSWRPERRFPGSTRTADFARTRSSPTSSCRSTTASSRTTTSTSPAASRTHCRRSICSPPTCTMPTEPTRTSATRLRLA